jgi:hypothetical protein
MIHFHINPISGANELALVWERQFIEMLRNYESDQFRVSFMSERSLEDEISRQSKSDALTVFLSYMYKLKIN